MSTSRVEEPSKPTESADRNMVTAGGGSTLKMDDADSKSEAASSTMGALLKDEESYKKELTKRRVLRGRLRGKIQKVQAAMECIIVPEDQETTEELATLEIQESLLHDQLRRAEKDIAELQELRQGVVSELGKEEHRSRASRSVFSYDARDGTSTSEVYLPTVSGKEKFHQSEDEIKPRTENADHKDNCGTRDSRTVPDSHFEVVEGILQESGAGSYSKGTDARLLFKVRDDIRIPDGMCGKTTYHSSVGSSEGLCEKSGSEIQRTAIIGNIRESLAKLSYGGPGKVDQFLDSAETIVLRCHKAYKDKSEMFRVVRAIVNTLPSGVAEKVISEVKREARSQRGSYRDVSEEDWETLLPFSLEVGDVITDGITVVDIIRDVSRTSEDTTRRETDKVALIAQPTSQQGVGMAVSQGSGSATSPHPPKQSLESWAKGFKASFVVTVKEWNEQEIKKTFQPDDWRPLRSRGKGQGQKVGKVKGKALMAKVAGDDQLKQKFRIKEVAKGKAFLL
ncbi:hypothetical protein Pmar_PMAR017091 [Perkinsus marinus ATCC 50983]|uniref:Uncharacterized protein n=1 Tax=Perkinsus marinus (strain ATCC 50983 / TXsc) TaxID=423536 RepID=C5LSJ2_PERM5|nr:hypothetical protein Pmar_PMAR017091 [Perkinsus marinus ATCC 50983]EER00233.1 hypothetical protein Pmar_PMAR017091 [Perkinsus marinus ATCC 50983]|eukprot:XP_002767515.1 hypothetical protein Pmar_PMAR017091 [Perkinsus marinus ATCC 50983]